MRLLEILIGESKTLDKITEEYEPNFKTYSLRMNLNKTLFRMILINTLIYIDYKQKSRFASMNKPGLIK